MGRHIKFFASHDVLFFTSIKSTKVEIQIHRGSTMELLHDRILNTSNLHSTMYSITLTG